MVSHSFFTGRYVDRQYKMLNETNSILKIVTNVFVQVVVLLYLLDNNENTSWMILLGSGMGVLVEAWKVWMVSSGLIMLLLISTSDHQSRRY
jgi:hypothetical protein